MVIFAQANIGVALPFSINGGRGQEDYKQLYCKANCIIVIYSKVLLQKAAINTFYRQIVP